MKFRPMRLGNTRPADSVTIAMIVCCIPMIAIALLLIATGVVSAGFIVVTAVCVVMMAVMMRGMDDKHGMG